MRSAVLLTIAVAASFATAQSTQSTTRPAAVGKTVHEINLDLRQQINDLKDRIAELERMMATLLTEKRNLQRELDSVNSKLASSNAPGVSLFGLTKGMTKKEVIDKIGHPTHYGEADLDGNEVIHWDNFGPGGDNLRVYFRNGRVVNAVKE